MVSELLRKKLFSIARNPISGLFIGYAFQHLSAWIPVQKIVEDSDMLAFYHPSPAWETHILIVPKKSVDTFERMIDENGQHRRLVFRILQIAQTIMAENDIPRYRIVVNGGIRQDVQQVHFHLITENGVRGSRPQEEARIQACTADMIDEIDNIGVYRHHSLDSRNLLVLIPRNGMPELRHVDVGDTDVQNIFLMVCEIVRKYSKRVAGYSFQVTDIEHDGRRQLAFLLYLDNDR